ncbi:nuclear receptor-interacting protein 1-like [Scleropages formosus]|nr:nuclear receptor-interacting protein 1-like [Scleropages formosus]
MHQDSAVLTYLEGLLMHQVATGPGATATRRSEAGHSNQEQDGKEAGDCQLQNHGSNQRQDRGMPLRGATQHLKKARLLRSEAWSGPEIRKLSAPVVDLNGHGSDIHTGALNGSSKCKGESTLLASLLQSFSSRLQTVALSQQIVESLKQQDCSQVNKSTQRAEGEEEVVSRPCYGAASNRLKGLMRKNKTQNHNSVPYRRRTNQERLSESPQASHGGAQPAVADSISCAARLKAVANLVNIRSSPATSPKPSVACSQLALLLSSEAHLQQYSREQALKAQLSGRSASERLAAMATQQTQDKKQANMGPAQMAPDMVSSLNTKNGISPQTALGSSKQSVTLLPGQSRTTCSPQAQHPFKEKRPFERHTNRPSQHCSSLLLQLLNNHNTQRRINGQDHLREDYSMFPCRSSPLLSDSEYSNTENSLPKDSSDAESSSSSCSPIDLSMRSKGSGPMLGSSSSLDKLTESLINTWKPKTPQPHSAETRELESNVTVKPHHKVTLLQLLLDHKNNEKVNKSPVNPDLQLSVNPKTNNIPAGRLTPIARAEEPRTQSPQGGMTGRNLQSMPTFSHGRDSNGSASPYSLYSSPHAQSIPLDLCKSKPCKSDTGVQEPAFSASKLLQNLAQCGLQKSASSPLLRTPLPTSHIQAHELNLDKHLTLLERLNAPVQRSKSPVLEVPCANFVSVPFVPEVSTPVSEVENLLEKRTVLQLLLGTASNKEKSSSKRKRPAARGSNLEKQPDRPGSCGSSNGLFLDIKIKSEPSEEAHPSDGDEALERCRSEGRECRSHSPASIPKRIIKSERLSPDTAPRDGLLSQLLKQQTRTYEADRQADSSAIAVKEEWQEHQGPALPKKRKFCLEFHNRLNSKSCVTLGRSSTPKDLGDECPVPATATGHNVKKPTSSLRTDTPGRCPVNELPPSDSGGFNVLKQLLLSDNCLKDLSQPRGAPSPSAQQVSSKVNGTSRHDFIGLQPNCSPQRSRPGDLKTAIANSASDSNPGSLWGGYAARQDSHKKNLVPLRRDLEGPVRWVVSEDEKQDSRPASPRLTKTNPILYYMLQRDNLHLSREGKVWETEILRCGTQVKVKEEPIADVNAVDHRLTLKHHLQQHNERHVCNSEHLDGLLKKC